MASAATIYSHFFRLCPIYTHHVWQLEKQRGYSEQEVLALGIRSTPNPADAQKVVDDLVEICGREPVLAVPGFAAGRNAILEDGSEAPGRVLFRAAKGQLLAQRGPGGDIESVVVRLDKPTEDGARYLPLTLDGKATIKTGVHFPSDRPEPLDRVRVAEGIFKAETATLRTDTYSVGMPNSGWWTKTFEAVREVAPDATIVVCPDADTRRNAGICLGLVHAVDALQGAGEGWELEHWDTDDGCQPKGIDDLLNSGGLPTVARGIERWNVLQHWLQECGAADPRVDARIKLDGVLEAVESDQTAAFKPGIPEALAHLDSGSVEAQSLLMTLQDKLRRSGWKQFKQRLDVQVKKNKRAREKARASEFKEALAAHGVRVFKRGDQAEVALVLLDDLTAFGSKERAYQRCIYADGDLYLYEDGIFQKQPHDELTTRVAAYAGHAVGTKGKALNVSETFCRGAVKIAYANRSQPEFFMNAPHGIAFSDKFVQAKDGDIKVSEHRLEHGARVKFDFDYRPGLPPRRFLAALSRWFIHNPEKDDFIACVQEHLGACLFGFAPHYSRALILRGDGNDGKSQLGKVYEGLFPEGAVSNVAPQDMHREYDRAALAGSLANVCYELPEGDLLDAAPCKAIVAGDKIKARQPYRPVFWLKPRAGHLFICNTLFKTKDFTRAFSRRWIILDFTAPIGTVEGDVDVADFATELLREERAAIACWAIEGAKRLLANGEYTIPEASHTAVAEWLNQSNNVAQYAAEQLVVVVLLSDEKGLDGPAIYDDYKHWIKDVNPSSTPLSRDRFLRRFRSWLQTQGTDKRHTNDGNYYPVQFRSRVEGNGYAGGQDMVDMLEAV